MDVLLTGASGYVGGRLLPRLLAAGHDVRCLLRKPVPIDGVEVVRGDLLDPASLGPALEGTEAAYYLVHSIAGGPGFEERDRTCARNFAAAAARAGLRRIVFLGALGRGTVSPHLRSRHEVGEILRAGEVPTLELRSSIVIGAGSASFEMVRALTERLPVMVTPRWVRVKAQPVAVDDLLDYLVQALDVPLPASAVYEVGGAERVSYAGLLRAYARARGLHRAIMPVPLLTPRLSSLWLGLVTPLQARIGRALIEGIRDATVVRDRSADEVFDVRPVGVDAAIARALGRPA